MINGILNVYKPSGVSSNFVVNKIRNILGIKKVGHTGTLDPLACGVLPICIGNATKISEYMLNGNKTYRVKLKFGILTDTYDCEGEILKTDNNINFSNSDLKNVLNDFVGEYNQVPPKFSALKINGRRAYDLARKGVDFKIQPRIVKIFYIKDIEFGGKVCSFEVNCSKGTYIRSLCRDIGDKLGTYATMTFLERTCSCNFTKETSIKFDNIDRESILSSIIPIEKVLKIPKLEINNFDFLRLVLNGVIVRNPKYIDGIDDGMYFLYNEDVIKGICEKKSDSFRIIKFLN